MASRPIWTSQLSGFLEAIAGAGERGDVPEAGERGDRPAAGDRADWIRAYSSRS
jgi:hypothetical protein